MILIFIFISFCWEDVDSIELKCLLFALKRGIMFFVLIFVIKIFFFFCMVFKVVKYIFFYWYNGEF